MTYAKCTIAFCALLNKCDRMVQVLTGSHDCTIRLWDLAAGKTKAVLTNHKKSVRALAMHPSESVYTLLLCTFCRGSLLLHVNQCEETKANAYMLFIYSKKTPRCFDPMTTRFLIWFFSN